MQAMKEEKTDMHKDDDMYVDDKEKRPVKKKPGEITILVRKAMDGDDEAKNTLYKKIMPHLKGIAKQRLYGERKGHTASSTEVLNDVYLKLLDMEGLNVNDRNHFYALASKYIRLYLIDNARRHRRARNNNGIRPSPINEDAINVKSNQQDADNVLDVHAALESLEKLHPGWVEIVDMRYFGGFTIKEIAEIKNVNIRTIERHWQFARAWLFTRMGGESENKSEQN